jgi:hypothetical protein
MRRVRELAATLGTGHAAARGVRPHSCSHGSHGRRRGLAGMAWPGSACWAATLRAGSSSCATDSASLRMSSVQWPGLTMWSYTMDRKR